MASSPQRSQPMAPSRSTRSRISTHSQSSAAAIGSAGYHFWRDEFIRNVTNYMTAEN